MELLDDIANWGEYPDIVHMHNRLISLANKETDLCIDWVLAHTDGFTTVWMNGGDFLTPRKQYKKCVFRRVFIRNLLTTLYSAIRLEYKPLKYIDHHITTKYYDRMKHDLFKSIFEPLLSLTRIEFSIFTARSQHRREIPRITNVISLSRYQKLRRLLLVWKKTRLRIVGKDVIMIIGGMVIKNEF